MQRQARGRGKGIHNIPTGVVRPAQEPSVSPSQDTVNASRANNNIIMHLPMSEHVEDIDDKMAVLEIPVEESN